MTVSAATGVTATTATLNGNVTADGGATVTERGFVYKTNSPVTISDNKTPVTGTTGAFSTNLSSLTTGVTYYFRAYASNSVGVTLSSEQSFTTGALAPPTLTSAVVATVDGSFDITFTDDSAWRTAITGITLGGSALPSGAYSTGTAGKITFTPSASALLQSPGTKAIVISATGYNDANINQTLGAGVGAQLSVTTQPGAPTFNGGALATQPVVAIRDQYGNATASTDNVTAAVGAGTWTLGGTATVAAVNGTATFSGLTATSAAAVTGATIGFTSGTMTGATSSGFNIPAPLLPGEILISQVYGGGGNTGATLIQDYVELYNPGTVDKDLTGWSIQYSAATASSWSVLALTGTIKAGKYFLVSLASGGTTGASLPTADLVGGGSSPNLSATAGKVALANTTTAFTTAFPTGSVDFVGFGATANAFEGSAAAPAPSATTAIFRAGNGATDSNNNSTDFTAAAPYPRNSTSGDAVGVITLNPTSITNLTAPVGGISAVQSYVVVGTNLGTTNLVITPNLSLIQISTNASSDFSTNAISFVPSAQGVVSNTIYVRVTNSTATNYSGTIGNVSGLASANLPVSGTIYALADYYSMASGNYSETFSNIASWTAPTTGSWQGLVVGGANTVPVATNITATTLSFAGTSSTGVQKGTENLVFLATGSTDNSTSIGTDLLLNFTGRKAEILSFDAATVFNSTGDKVSSLRVFASTNGIDWAEMTGGGLPFLSTNNVAGSASVSVPLPSLLDNASQGRLRFYVHNGSGGTGGSRPKISIDNVVVTSSDASPLPPTITSTNAFSGTVGIPFGTNVTASGFTPITFSGADLPGGLMVASNGSLTGTPNAAGTFNATLIASNSLGTNSQPVTFTIAKGNSTISATGSTSFAYNGSGQGPDTHSKTGSSGAVTYSYAGTGGTTYASSSNKPTNAGSYNVTAILAADSNYNGATSSVVGFSILRATPSITWSNPALITYGTALSAMQLNATSSVAGSFAYNPTSGTVLNVGSNQVVATFTAGDTNNYSSPVLSTNTVVVTKATPVITWNTPAPIIVGTPLSATQLNATSSVTGGTYTYTPAGGATNLPVGANTLTVVFSTTNSNYISPVTNSVILTVNAAGPTFATAYPGIELTNVAPNGLTYLVNYAFGGTSSNAPKLPEQDTSDPTKLTLVAYVRTNDTGTPPLSVKGQTNNSLDGWSTNTFGPSSVTNDLSGPPGTQKQIFSVTNNGNDRLFLRLKVSK